MDYYDNFLEYIINHGLYIEGYDYVTMYNIMVYNILENMIPLDTIEEINELYNLLTPLILNNQLNEMNENEMNENEMNENENEMNYQT